MKGKKSEKQLDEFMWVMEVAGEGGGGELQAYVGHFASIAFPILRNLTKNLGPRVGTFAFFVRRNGTKSHCPSSSVRRR